MQNPLYIFGAGGHGRVIIDTAMECNDRPSIVLDDHPHAANLFGIQIFSAVDFPFEPGFRFVVAIGDPAVRREKFEWLLGKGGLPATIIHPAASVSKQSTIGRGTLVFARAIIDPSVTIGENAIINAGAIVGHDSVICDDAHVSGGALVGANARVGQATFVGLGAIVSSGVKVGDGAFIAMGALVSHDVPDRFKAVSPHRREAILAPIHDRLE